MLNFRAVVAAAILLAAAVLAVEAFRIAGLAGRYPQVLVAVVIALTLVVAVEEARSRRRLADIDTELAALWSERPTARLLLLVFVGIWLAYPLLLTLLGFIVATSCVLLVSLWTAGYRRIGPVVTLAVGFSVVLAVVLKTVLYVPVPLGAIDIAVDRLLYLMRG